MRHKILALVFISLVAALFLFSGCGRMEKAPEKAPEAAPDAAPEEAIESTEAEVSQASEEIVEMEEELDAEQVDLDVASLFEDY